MNIEEFRAYCLSLPGVSERMPFVNGADKRNRDILCFYIGEKWFCFVNAAEFEFCCIKCDPDRSIDLRDRYAGIEPGWHMNKKYWISVYFDRDVPDALIQELVRHSYDLVYASLTKKEKDSLTGVPGTPRSDPE